LAEIQGSSIDEFIENYRDMDINFDKMHLKEIANLTDDGSSTSEVIILDEPLMDKYREDLETILTQKTFTSKEKSVYLYNPWKLSYDLYGSTEYWWLLLDANQMHSVTEFNKTTINVYEGILPTMIGYILNLEEATIKKNNSELELSELFDNIDYDNSDSYDDISEDSFD